MLSRDDLTALAQSAGFELAGAAPVEALGGGWFKPHADRLKAWLAAGHHGDMDWLVEQASSRTVPQQLLPGVRSAIVLWLPHRTPDIPRPDHVTARVARYAWGRDYHNIGRKSVRKLRRALSARWPEMKSYASVDTGAILERAFGERASVGWIGRSTMLIHPRLGTFGSLVVLFIDQDVEWAEDNHPFRCGTCTACVDACPTGAISEAGVDARKCISYWTIEHRGVIPAEIRPSLGEWVFGCDICQDVCPWNHDAPRADPERWRPQPERAWPDLQAWVAGSSDALHASLEGSPMRRARGDGLRRNALIALANLGDSAALPVVRAAFGDPDPVIRASAFWAARVLGDSECALQALADPDPQVRAEATTPLPSKRA